MYCGVEANVVVCVLSGKCYDSQEPNVWVLVAKGGNARTNDSVGQQQVNTHLIHLARYGPRQIQVRWPDYLPCSRKTDSCATNYAAVLQQTYRLRDTLTSHRYISNGDVLQGPIQGDDV